MTIVNYKDFMNMACINEEIPNIDGLYGAQRDGITEKQKTFLRQLGIGTTGLKYKGQASKVIDLRTGYSRADEKAYEMRNQERPPVFVYER